MDLEISDLRMILKLFRIDFNLYLSDSEVNDFHVSRAPGTMVLSDGIEVSADTVNLQQRFYDELDLYVRLLNELLKNRPLPF